MIPHASRETGARCPSPMTETEQALMLRARAGELVRDEVILSLQTRITMMACGFLRRVSLQSAAFDQDDLIQSANEGMLRSFPLALTKDHPIAYLLRVARLEMQAYLNGRHGTIRTEPQWHRPVTVLSLDRVLQEDTTETFAGCLSADPPLETAEEPDGYEPLYEAIEQLPERQREVIKRHYGLKGYAPVSLMAIARELSPDTASRPKSAHYHHRQALLKLAATLECSLTPLV